MDREATEGGKMAGAEVVEEGVGLQEVEVLYVVEVVEVVVDGPDRIQIQLTLMMVG